MAFFWLLIRDKPITENAIITSIGDNYITVYVGVYGFEGNIYFDKLNIYTSQFDAIEQKCIVYWGKDPNVKVEKMKKICTHFKEQIKTN